MNKSQFVNWYMSCLVSNSKFYPEISDAKVEVIYVVKKKKTILQYHSNGQITQRTPIMTSLLDLWSNT